MLDSNIGNDIYSMKIAAITEDDDDDDDGDE